MRIYNLTENSKVYTSNVFLVMGEWNTVDDLTTLIDVGYDSSIINKIQNMNMGLGKKKIDQVVLTHCHSDHTAILPEIIQAFHPVVFAYNSYLKGIDRILLDESTLKIGDRKFEVFHITAHSSDSICLYCEQEQILFAGDTNFPIDFENPQLKEENEYPLWRLSTKKINKVFNGHGQIHDYSNRTFKIIKEADKLFDT